MKHGKRAFGSCLRHRLKGRHYRTKRSQRKAFGAAVRHCSKYR